MSVRQIARTVVDGRKVTFHVFDCDTITGYVAGMDDYNWLVVEPLGGLCNTMLVHKGSVSVAKLHEGSSFKNEPLYEVMEPIVGPFRRWCSAQVFGREERPASNDTPTPISGGRRPRQPQGRIA